MRFTEFKNTDKQLESALVNTLLNLKGDADDKNTSAEISFAAVTEIMRNTGYPAFSYDLFKQLHDNGKVLKNVVADLASVPPAILIKLSRDSLSRIS